MKLDPVPQKFPSRRRQILMREDSNDSSKSQKEKSMVVNLQQINKATMKEHDVTRDRFKFYSTVKSFLHSRYR